MSTEFRTASTDEFTFQRFGLGSGEVGLEFVTRGNRDRVFEAAFNGEVFVGEDGSTFGLGDLLEFSSREAVFVGRFGGVTLEAGEALALEFERSQEGS